MRDNILLIDGLNFIHRANIAFQPKPGEKSFNVVYNFFRGLRALVEELSPEKIFFCLEGANNHRYALFPEYKANRIIKTASKPQEQKDEFNNQRDIIIELISALPITAVMADTFEADDVIATLVENLKDEKTTIVSNDSDFIQLLQKGYKNTSIYNPFKKSYMEAPEVFYLVWKSLRGDKSDNIPSLVGDKTAEKMLNNPDLLAEFLSSEENRANFALNRELIELKIVPDDKLQFTEYNVNFDRLKEAFENMDLKTMIEVKYWDRFCATFKEVR